LRELARYHAATFHYLNTFGPDGEADFLKAYPDFGLEGSVLMLITY
jgi:hypothetical protein